jgi:regulator of sigma E protease
VDGKAIATWQDVRWQLLNAVLKKTQVNIQTIDEQQAIHQYQLDLSQVNQDDYHRDILDQLGLKPYQVKSPPLIGEVLKNSRAAAAGLKPNDLVLSINHHPVTVWENFVEEIRRQPNVKLEVTVLRARNTITISVTPESANEGGKTIGRIGVGVKLEQVDVDKIFITTHYSVWQSLLKATEKTWDTSIFSLKMLGSMLTGQSSWKAMSGPVTIASYAGQSAHMGLKSFIGFLALISISIGVLNLLPVPVLDGGHLMYYVIEIFTGKTVSDSIMVIGQKVGFALLALMMFLALYNDINRLITG